MKAEWDQGYKDGLAQAIRLIEDTYLGDDPFIRRNAVTDMLREEIKNV